MASGNFLVGEYLPKREMETIQEYVLPHLVESGLTINNKLLIILAINIST